MIYEICVALLTIFFIILVIYVIITLKRINVTLQKTNEIVDKVNKDLNPLRSQAQELLRESAEISHTLKNQIDAFNPIFNSISLIGEKIENFTSSNLDDEPKKKENGEEDKNYILDLLDIGARGVVLWQQYKKRK